MSRRFAILVGAAMTAACTTSGGAPPALPLRTTDSAVKQLGFDTVTLPSTAYGPGSLVTTVRGSGFTEPLRLTYLCRPDFAKAPPPIIDDAASAEASRAFNGAFNLDLAALKTLGLGAKASYVDSVTLQFSNIKVEQLPVTDLRAIQTSLGPECTKLLAEFKAKGIARQTQQALRADVTYTATLKQGASADVKNLVIQALQASFGGSVQSDSGASVTGKGLYYGLTLMPL